MLDRIAKRRTKELPQNMFYKYQSNNERFIPHLYKHRPDMIHPVFVSTVDDVAENISVTQL